MKTNCEKDNSTSLLKNFSEIVMAPKKQVDNKVSGAKTVSSNVQYPSDLIFFDPDIPELNCIETDELSYISSVICDNLVKVIDCELCLNNIQADLKESVHDIISSISNSCYPSQTFISNLKKVWHGMNALLPELCTARPLKKTLVSNVYDIIIDKMGCKKHNKSIKTKFLNITALHVIKTFCKNINDLLSNKTTILSDNCKDVQIYQVAFAFRKKKKIGKFTDIFNEN